MHTYRVTTDYYRVLLANCRAELRLLGYSGGVVRLAGAAEFLGRLEGRGIVTLATVGPADITAHLTHLYDRPHSRRGGPFP